MGNEKKGRVMRIGDALGDLAKGREHLVERNRTGEAPAKPNPEAGDEDLRNFIAARFDAIEERLTKRLDAQDSMLSRQAEELQKLRDVFDRILTDYFERVVEAVKALSEAGSPEEIRARLEALSQSISMVDPETAKLAGREMRSLYDGLIPEIRKIVAEEREKLYEDIGDDSEGIGEAIVEAMNKHAQNLVNHIYHSDSAKAKEIIRKIAEEGSETRSRIGSSAREIKMAARPLGSRNTYPN